MTDIEIFDGQEVKATAIQVNASPITAENGTIVRKGERFSAVGHLRCIQVVHTDVSGVPTRKQVSKYEEAHIVPEAMVQDLLEEIREQDTGQARLLSPDGEVRRAARIAVHENEMSDLAITGDDALEVTEDYQQAIVNHLEHIDDLKQRQDDYDTPGAFFDALEQAGAELAACSLGLITAAHAGRCEFNEEEAARNQREFEEETAARLNAEAVHSDENEHDGHTVVIPNEVERDPTTGAVGRTVENPCERSGEEHPGVEDRRLRKGSEVQCPGCNTTVVLEAEKRIPVHSDPFF